MKSHLIADRKPSRRKIIDRSNCDPVMFFSTKFIKQDNGCWEWIGTKNRGGYGVFTHCGRFWFAHRFCYLSMRGSIPDGLVIDHLCRNHSCINPDHLEPVTSSENIKRGFVGESTRNRYARQTHCIHGHEYTPENTYRRPSGYRGRICRTCYREAYRRRRKEGNHGPN